MDSGWSLPAVAAATSAIYLFHGFVLAPLAERALRRAETRRVGFWAAFVTTIAASKLVWMTLALSALLTLGALLVAGHLGGDTAAAATSAIQRLRGLRHLIMTLEGGGSLLVLGLATAALLFWIWRYRVRRAAGVLQQIHEAQIESLFEKLKEGALPDLEPTAEMREAGSFYQWLLGRAEAIEAELAATTSDAIKQRLSKERDELVEKQQLALNLYVRADLERRVQVTPLDVMEGDIPRPARTIFEHIGRFFISRGLLGRLTWAQRALLVVNLVLAIPTALVAAEADIGQRLDRRTLQLADLSVDWRSREEAARLASAARAPETDSQKPADKPMDQKIEQAANRVAQAFEVHLGRAFSQSLRQAGAPEPLSDAEVLKARSDMRAEKARHDILALKAADHPEAEIFVDPDPARPSGRDAYSPAAKRTMPGTADWSTQTASALARDDGRPVSATGRRMAQELRDSAAASSKFREALVKAADSFREVARPSQVGEILLAEIFSGVAHVAPADAMPPEMHRWITESVSRSTSVRVNSALSNTFRATLFATRDVAKATAALDEVARVSLATADFSAARPIVEASLPSDTEFADIARSRHPGLRQAVDAKAAGAQHDLTKAVYVKRFDLHDMTHQQNAALDSVMARSGAIQTFDELVPPSIGGAPGTGETPPGGSPMPSGPRPSEGGGSGGGFGGGGAHGERATGRAPIRPSSPAAVARARSFVSLRGFSRVGGVLIGRNPEPGGPPLDVRGFDWHRDGGTLRFKIRSAEGSVIEAGPYHASVIHGALAYAADGRALTATMISAEPLEDALKILLHPALLDTALGCRTISIDRFADEATGRESYPDRERAERALDADVWLYEIARAAIVDIIVGRLQEKDASYLKQSVERAHSLLAVLRSTDGDGSRVRDLIDAAAKRSDPSDRQRSVLHRQDHFSPAVTDLVETCQGANVGGTQFAACVQDKAKSLYSSDFLLTSRLKSALQPVPQYQTWSGVREAPYAVDARLSFFVHPRRDVLQFMVQVAFTSQPFQKELETGRELSEAESQTAPYEFDWLKISDKVQSLVASSREKQDVYDGVAEFTTLQRFFRLALHGGLGSEFPVERLTELEAATRGDVKRQKTPRWNSRYPEPIFLASLAKALPTMPASLKTKAESCLKANGLDSVANPTDVQSLFDAWKQKKPISSESWAATCVFDVSATTPSVQAPSRELAELADRSHSYPAIRDLRHSLGIDTDERSKVEACEPM